jgi:hypothetical protein
MDDLIISYETKNWLLAFNTLDATVPSTLVWECQCLYFLGIVSCQVIASTAAAITV